MATFKETKVHDRTKITMMSMLKEFRSFAADIQQVVDAMLVDVFLVGEEIYQRYISSPRTTTEEYHQKTGE